MRKLNAFAQMATYSIKNYNNVSIIKSKIVAIKALNLLVSKIIITF